MSSEKIETVRNLIIKSKDHAAPMAERAACRTQARRVMEKYGISKADIKTRSQPERTQSVDMYTISFLLLALNTKWKIDNIRLVAGWVESVGGRVVCEDRRIVFTIPDAYRGRLLRLLHSALSKQHRPSTKKRSTLVDWVFWTLGCIFIVSIIAALI